MKVSSPVRAGGITVQHNRSSRRETDGNGSSRVKLKTQVRRRAYAAAQSQVGRAAELQPQRNRGFVGVKVTRRVRADGLSPKHNRRLFRLV